MPNTLKNTLEKTYLFIKQQGISYIILLILPILLLILALCNDIDKKSIIMLFISIVLIITTLTANIIKGEHRLKEEISSLGLYLIAAFIVASLVYLYLSNSTDSDWAIKTIESISTMMFNISIFFMGNLLNLIKTEKKEKEIKSKII